MALQSQSALQDISGELLLNEDTAAGAIPPLGAKNAIPFKITGVQQEGAVDPAWAEIIVGGKLHVRINPEICEAPYSRLFGCLKTVWSDAQTILALKGDDKHAVEFEGEPFFFWPAHDEQQTIVVDTEERLLKWNPDFLFN